MIYDEESHPVLLLGLLFQLVNVVIALAITIPLVGALVRYRAHYGPRAVQLGTSEDAPVTTGPVIDGYFVTLRRVHKLEGWAGLYKGTMPVVLVAVLYALTAIPAIIRTGKPWPDRGHHSPHSLLIMFAFGVLSLLFSIPFSIITYRAITTPYKLPYFGLRKSLRVLLTATERARPWTLYLTPGLFVTQFLTIALMILGLIPLQHLILPNFPKSKHEIDAAIIGRLVGFFAIITIGTTVIVPLEIMANRLALQRNHASALPQDGDVVAEELTPYSATEDVIGLRDESDPYLSFVDTAKRMVAEEGCRTMFRAWWITFISLLVTGIVGAWHQGPPPPGSLHILGF